MTAKSLTPQDMKDCILAQQIPAVAEEGWAWHGTQQAARVAGFQDGMAETLFPAGLSDVVAWFSDYNDRRMLTKLGAAAPPALRTRDRVRCAAWMRFRQMEDHKDAVRYAMAYWTAPTRVLQGQRVLWRTADRIWNWSGDMSKDHNRQTKRALLASILVGTSMVWVDDQSENHIVSEAFLNRRLENVMEIGRAIGTIGSIAPTLLRRTTGQ